MQKTFLGSVFWRGVAFYHLLRWVLCLSYCVRGSLVSAGCPMEMRFSGMMFSGMLSTFLIDLRRCSRGYTPSQTAPRPSAVVANSRFSVAAEQSWIQKLAEMSVSPQTAMQRGASRSILACG